MQNKQDKEFNPLEYHYSDDLKEWFSRLEKYQNKLNDKALLEIVFGFCGEMAKEVVILQERVMKLEDEREEQEK
jgi:hypothetical protein